ncbi:tyrosine-type recombinase/integrase [Providencia stuartii]|uniref:tyrosine-type recombinase/integrase n=1 Tax=Providencia TaxID=586 RepID=UPI0013A79C15|nr:MULTISPECIES: site-specific integrase [Providencia]MBQ0456016.1 site-specific integrase [Providencia stuartii]MDN7224057.1 site-specific integrase [Providencia stuartii]QIB29834.1 site-specific integrase [Providencia stuartii]QPN42140.1 site-specific integrase [Providencia sp. 2.29]WAZ77151.1 site-specific integrase [Providencia stuartii]
MASRPRKKEFRHLPDFLYYDSSKKQYRLTLVNGVRKNIGADKTRAIAIAREYNNIMRPENAISVNSLVIESGGQNGEALPLSEHLEKLFERIVRDEQPSKSTLSDWTNDLERVSAFFKDIPSNEISLEHVNGFINEYHADASANVQNRKVSFLKKIFSYAVDESLMFDNPAERKKMKRVDAKKRRRLSYDDFLKIRDAAEPWLRTAMDLALQTTQARLEVSRIKYSIKAPKNNTCGCVWYEEEKNGIFGMIYIHRQKVQHKEAAHVAIPIGKKLKEIIDNSRDNVASPYIVHRLPARLPNNISKEVNHPTQIAPDYLSRAFSALRDKTGVAANLSMDERPTFHEIRALAAFMFKDRGYDPQARMAHSDAESTKIYTENHVEWVEVPHCEIA